MSAVDLLLIVTLRSRTGFDKLSTSEMRGFATTLFFPEDENIEADGDFVRAEYASPCSDAADGRVKVLLDEKLLLEP